MIVGFIGFGLIDNRKTGPSDLGGAWQAHTNQIEFATQIDRIRQISLHGINISTQQRP